MIRRMSDGRWIAVGTLAAMAVGLLPGLLRAETSDTWTVDSTPQWKKARAGGHHLSLAEGEVRPTGKQARFESVMKTYQYTRHPKAITFKQSPVWDNWKTVENVGPKGTANAPVFLPVGKGDYWYFAEDRNGESGYSAWHSTDMKNWKGYGQVTESRWVTSAEYADGKCYLYYDEPNDEDPHLVIDKDLRDGKNRDMGEVFADPSHGSDSGIFREADGSFHLIYEDWSPINARAHSWDSPLAGHAASPDGIRGFEPHEFPAPIDERTVPLPEFGTYNHGPTGEHRFHKHEGPQNAYGDFTMIKVASQYYLFCDYDPHNKPMRVGYWTNDSLDDRFEWGGDVGKGFHPDPTIGFAEGRFYLIVQRNANDFVSPGPWVETVKARVGVDIEGDDQIDQWTDWQEVRERYSSKPGFARIVETSPARLDLASLPAGRGFQFELKAEDSTKNKSKPILDRVTLGFE